VVIAWKVRNIRFTRLPIIKAGWLILITNIISIYCSSLKKGMLTVKIKLKVWSVKQVLNIITTEFKKKYLTRASGIRRYSVKK